MIPPTISPGCILHWEGYTFEDGSEKDKYFVIVGCKEKSNLLAIITTSQQWKRQRVPGASIDGGWYFIEGGGKDWFKKDTWLLFDTAVEISSAEFLKLAWGKTITLKGNLRPDIANAIMNAMSKCDDVSELHKGLLGPKHQPKGPK